MDIFNRNAKIEARIAAAYPRAQGVTDKLLEVADAVDADPYALANLIQFESGWNPQARNGVTGATGLIQFMPATARGLGTSTGALAGMGARQQLDFVQRYLDQARKGRSLQDPAKLAMTVFYPVAVRWPRWAWFPWKVIRSNGWRVFSPEDYVLRMEKHAKLPATVGLIP